MMDPAKMKVVDLRNELSSRGLDTKGNKAVLVKRLKDALEKELEHDIPDTSIADTSTEDLDTSQVAEEAAKEEAEQKLENKSEPPNQSVVEPEPPEERTVNPESEQEPVEDKKEENVSEEPTQENVSEELKQENVSNETKQESDSEGSKQETVITSEKNGENVEHTEEKPAEESTEVKVEEEQKMDETTESKGEKRKREEEDSSEKKIRSRSPVKEDEPEIDYEKPKLSWYDSDLNLQVDKQSFLSAKPLNDGAFGFIWAGARATYGVSSGKVYYEVKITEKMDWQDPIKQSELSDRNRPKNKYRTDHRNDKKQDQSKNSSDQQTEPPKENEEQQPETAEKMETDEATDEKKEQSADAAEDQPKTEDNKGDDSEEKSEKMETTEDSAVEAKESEKKEEEAEPEETKKEAEPEPIATHLIRVGFSLLGSSLQLGECKHSFGYESSGKFVTDKQFQDYGVTFGAGDVIGAYLNIDTEQVTITYTVNGVLQPPAISVPVSDFPENFSLFPHVLSRNYAFELNFGDKEEPFFPKLEELNDYKFLTDCENKVAGPRRPDTRNDCEVVLMIGLPAAGKTHWVKEYIKTNPEKEYTIIGNSALLDKMTVCAEPLKARFRGSWKTLIDKLHKCLNRITDIASQRRRNFIIDQTNLFPAVQRRKMRSFEGFKRRAVVIVVGDEEQKRRQQLQGTQDGKDVPESTLFELKAAMELPDQGDWLDEILYAELSEEEAKKMVKKYNDEARAKGYSKRFPRRDNRRGGYGQNNYRDRNYSRQPYGNRYSQGGWDRQGGGWERRDGRGGGGGWRSNRPDRGAQRDYGRQGGSGGGGYNRNPPNYRGGGGRSGGGNWQQAGGWGGANGSGRSGGWNQQVFGGYGKWHQNEGGWSYANQSQSGYGGQAQGRQNWNYYGQYGQQQGWGGSGGQQY